MQVMFGLAILSFGGFELYNYVQYKRVLNFITQKRSHKQKHIDHEFMKKYWLENLSDEELKQWIKNTISYNYTKESDRYYREVAFENISRTKMIEWVSYNLFFKDVVDCSEEEISYTNKVLDEMQIKINHQFIINDNLDKDVYFLRFGENSIESAYKPLIVYSGFTIMKNISYMMLGSYGFKKYRTKHSNIVYFYYNDEKNKETTMFIHGLGFGITPYLSHILALRENTNLIVPIIPNISNMEYNTNFKSFNNNDLFPDYKNWRKDIKMIIKDHQIDEINIIAHSFGTIVLGLLLKDNFLNSVIKKRIFVDPVCFMEESYKIYRYINEPDFGKESMINDIFNTIIYKDVYLRYVSQRFLFGPEYWITNYDELSNKNNLIILSFNDQMIPIITLYNKMLKHKIPCLLIDRAYHADIFMTDEFKIVVDYMKEHILDK